MDTLEITATGVFYHQRTHVAFFVTILATKSGDSFVKFFAGYVLNKVLNTAFSKKLQKTAYAQPDGWLYLNREYYERNYFYDDSGTKTEDRSIDTKANALYHKAYNTSGTDSSLIPAALDQNEILAEVSHNPNLTSHSKIYAVLEQKSDGSWTPLFTWDRRRPSQRWLQSITFSWGRLRQGTHCV